MKRRIALGFAVAALLLAVLVNVVGRDEVATELIEADPRLLVACLGSGVLALTFRGLVWMQFFGAIDEAMDRLRIVGVFLSAMFIKYVTPYGQVATEPFVAYLISRDEEMAYEDGLAGVLSADVLNYVPYYTFGFLAIGLIVADDALGSGIGHYLLAFSGVFIALVTVSFVVVRRPDIVYRIVLSSVGVIKRPVERVASSFGATLSPPTVRERLDGFYGSIDTIAADRRMLIVSACYAHLGMFFLTFPLYLGGLAIGHEIELSVAILAVALGKLGAFVPAPGGLGGVEAAVTVTLVVLGSVSEPAALSIALIYRVSTYWLTIGVGSVAAFTVVVRR